MIEPRPEVKIILHEFRFKRFLNLTRDIPRYPDTCAWCGRKKPRAMKYCSGDCRFEVNIRNSGLCVTRYVFKRDKGICLLCGIDTNEIRKEYLNIERLSWKFRDVNFKKQWGPWYTNNYVFWEADHITSVSQGGGCCGIENYRTLCLRCHKLSHKKRAR